MAFIDFQNDRPSHCFLSGILSFTTGTTCSRRRSLCTSTQSPTSPACDQRRLHSHASTGPPGPTPPPHDAAVLVGVHHRLMLQSWWDFRIMMLVLQFSRNSSCAPPRWQRPERHRSSVPPMLVLLSQRFQLNCQ